MSVLHPAGPEEPQTYWLRRALVIGAVVVVLAVIVALVVSAVSTGSAVQANPSPIAPSPLVVPTSAAPSASDTTAPSASPTASASASATASAKESKTATAKAGATVKASPKPTPTKTKKPVPVACDAGDVRVTLTGKQHLKRKQANKFSLSLINGSDVTCIGSVTGKNFELKIYSGRDRIWSSDDCTTGVKPISTTLKTQQDVAWTMTWNGRRSRDDCKNRPEIPRAGTYFATAQLKGAKPVQLRMIIRS